MRKTTEAREIPAHSPYEDFADKYPEWTATVADLHGIDEVIDVDRHLILIDPKKDGKAWALAHVTAHLDLDHHLDLSASFTERQESDANDLASLRMGGVPETFALPPLDGEPTVPLHRRR